MKTYSHLFSFLTLDCIQLSVDGAISLSNVALNIRTINCLIEEADLPVEFVDGYIQVFVKNKPRKGSNQKKNGKKAVRLTAWVDPPPPSPEAVKKM